MIVDRTHVMPAVATGLATIAIGTHYYLRHHGAEAVLPSGGSLPGLCYGTAGWLIIVFGCALSLRRKYSHLQLGSAQSWLRAHIWLCLLCVPIVLFHCGFAMRGDLAGLVAVLFTLVILSGIYGLSLQQFMPRRMTRGLARETVLDEMPSLMHQLAVEACEKVRSACLAENWDGTVPPALEMPTADGSSTPTKGTTSDTAFRPGTRPLVDFYAKHVRPFLAGQASGMEKVVSRDAAFNHIRTVVPDALYETIDDLESICHERADMDWQRFLHKMLHGWFLVHVPISMMLLLFVTIHAVQAVRFVKWTW